ncbi:hypothetical protein AB4Z38_01140 [Arthrobacter sp. 2RAF6]
MLRRNSCAIAADSRTETNKQSTTAGGTIGAARRRRVLLLP